MASAGVVEVVTDVDEGGAGVGVGVTVEVVGFADDEVFAGRVGCAALVFTDPEVAPALTDPPAETGDVGALVAAAPDGVTAADAGATLLPADTAADDAGDVGVAGVDTVGGDAVLGPGASAGLGTLASASPDPAETWDGAASTPVNDGLLASLVRVVASAAADVLCRARAMTR